MATVTLTENARTRLLTFLTAQNETTAYFTIENKGCGGNQYSMGVIDAAEITQADEVISLDETHSFVIEGTILPFVGGTLIDWKTDAFTGSFSFENPNSTGSCGCGNSFSVVDSPITSCSA